MNFKSFFLMMICSCLLTGTWAKDLTPEQKAKQKQFLRELVQFLDEEKLDPMLNENTIVFINEGIKHWLKVTYEDNGNFLVNLSRSGYHIERPDCFRDVTDEVNKSVKSVKLYLTEEDRVRLETEQYIRSAEDYKYVVIPDLQNLAAVDKRFKELYDKCRKELAKPKPPVSSSEPATTSNSGQPTTSNSIQPVYVPPVSDKTIGGRNISFGITAGMVFPSFATSASGNYLASAVNYDYDAENERADYSSETGFTAGVIIDVRLIKNFYLQTGLNYTSVKMTNKFSGEYVETFTMTNTTYVEGWAYDEFTEKYKLNYLDIPLIFSYRLKLSEKINWQINAGPYIGFGFSGKCKVNGTTDMPLLTEYYTSNDNPTGGTFYQNCNVSGEFDLFGTSGTRKDSYTTGAQDVFDTDYTFKSAPFKNLNAGLSFGTSIEFAGFNIGLSYDIGLTNIANDDFWKSERFPISDYNGTERMENYSHKLNKFQIKLAYIFRY
jgi:hypothetical protein